MTSLLSVLALAMLAAHAQPVFKCVASDGKILFSSEPCPKGDKSTAVIGSREAAPNRPPVATPLRPPSLDAAVSPTSSAPGKAPIADPFGSQWSPPRPPPKRIWPLEGSFAKCILNDMPGVANDLAARGIYVACWNRYPDGLNTIEGGGPLGFDSPAECMAKKGRDTISQLASRTIYSACYHRYATK